MKYLRYLAYVLRHKWFVGVACFRAGLYWRGIIHDLSKLRPSEFIPYARFFAAQQPRDSTGYYNPTDADDPDFRRAWFLHTRRNDHHWQYWVLPRADGDKLMDMSLAAVREMVCDWWGAGRAQHNNTTPFEWYSAHKRQMLLSTCSRRRLWTTLMGYPRNWNRASGKFRKLPVEVNAIHVEKRLRIDTLEGPLWAKPGDWVVTGVDGEPYPVRDDIFRRTYEPVDERAKELLDES